MRLRRPFAPPLRHDVHGGLTGPLPAGCRPPDRNREVPVIQRNQRRRTMAAAAVSLCMLTGCQPAMSKPSDPSTALRPGDVVRNKFPLRFEEHSFEAYCYNTVG